MSHDMDVAGALIAPPNAAETPAESATIGTATEPNDSDRTRAKILQHIIGQTIAAPLPAAWSFLLPTDTVRSLACTPPELIASLQSSFSAAELEVARVLVHRPNELVQLAPVLIEPRFQVLNGDDHNPIELVSDAGGLYGDDPPCFQFSLQRLAGADRPRRVLVAPLEDLQVLRCLGFTCTSAAGLAQLNGEQVRRLYAGLSPRTPPRYVLTLVGMGLASLEPKLPAHIKPILERMWHVENLFGSGTDIELFDVWRPSEKDVHRIRAAVTFSDGKIVRRAIGDSLKISVSSCRGAWQHLHEPAGGGLVDAHQGLIRAMSSYGGRESGVLEAAIARLGGELERATTQRYLQEAAAAPHPFTRTAYLLMAEISHRVNHNYGPLANARLMNSSSWRDVNPEPLTEEQFNEINETVQIITNLSRLLLPNS